MTSDVDRLAAIVALIDRIDDSLGGCDLAAFTAHPLLADATAYRLLHIGENSRHLSDELKRRHPEQPWALMVGFRNQTAHDYFGSATPIIWTTARYHLAALRQLCSAELDKGTIQGD
ncbi:MAG: DUF86 domain-containing protein [Sphingomonadaceae bacterium]|nr:DUF86 domain-containing protein [Sphingomonadaceae bacterium]